MKSRHIPFRDGPYRGRHGRIHRRPVAGWPRELHIPYPIDAPWTVLVYRPVTNSDDNPTGLEWLRSEPVSGVVAAVRVGAVYVAQDGTTWTEGEDVSGGWVCATEAAGCGRIL